MEIKINYSKYEGFRNEVESNTLGSINKAKIFKQFYNSNKLKVDNRIKSVLNGHNVYTGGTISFSIEDSQYTEFKIVTFYIESLNESSCMLFFKSIS